MGQVPDLSGREVVQLLERFGWHLARQRGSHIILVKPGEYATLSVPDHKTIAKGTLRSLLRAANVTLAEFIHKMN